MHRFYILICFLCCYVNCVAQDPENVFGDSSDTTYEDAIIEEARTQPDTVLIKNAVFVSVDSIRKLKNRKEFAYIPLMDSLLKSETSLTDKKIKTTLSLAERFLNSAFFRFFLWLIPISLLLIVLYNFAKSQGSFTRKKKTEVLEYNEDDVQNTVHDYLALSREAAAAGLYRPAVKYLFLRTLQQLSAAGMISFASEKTNYSYVQEIDATKRREFAKLVLNFEYVWYGNAVPDNEMFTEIEIQFASFLKKYNLN